MADIVKYGSFSFGEAGLPLPFVSLDYDYEKKGKKWITIETITLNGEFNACSKEQYLSFQNQITKAFSKDYQTLTITGMDSPKNLVEVESISFPPSDFLISMSYTIVLKSKDALHDVVDPVDQVDFTQNEDKTITLRHTISAKGVRTDKDSNDAYANAQAFVKERVNESQSALERPMPGLINMPKNPNARRIFMSNEERVDRIKGEYAVIRTYIIDMVAESMGGTILLRYTKTIDETFPKDGSTAQKTTTYSGSIKSGLDTPAGKVTQALKNFKHSLNTDLVNTLISAFSISEDGCGNTNFSFTYGADGDNGKLEVIDDQCITISKSFESNSVSVSVSGTLSAKGPRGTIGEDDCRWGMVQEAFDPSKYQAQAQELYLEHQADAKKENQAAGISVCENEDDPELSKVPNSSSVTKNPYDATISYSYSFSTPGNKEKTAENQKYDFQYTTTVRLSLGAIGVNPLVGGGYAFVDLGYNHRGQVTISGTAEKLKEDMGESETDPCPSDETDEGSESSIRAVVDSEVLSLLGSIESVLEAQSFGVTDEGKLSFSYTYSFGGKAATDAENGNFIDIIRLQPTM